MRADEQIDAEIRRLRAEANHCPPGSPASKNIDEKIAKVELELWDSEALVPENDLRETDCQTEQ